MLPTTQTVNELQAKATETLVAHYPNWQWSGTCRCGYGYGFDPTDTWAQHTARKLYPITPKDKTRC